MTSPVSGHETDVPRTHPQRTLPLALIALSALISSVQIYWHTFLDESDNLYFGYRMARGGVLYTDMFSHHFPFPYWWIALVTIVFGKSITAVRLSLTAFQVVAFSVATAFSAFPIAIGLTALAWSTVAYLYFGNLLIAYTFKALALFTMLAGLLFERPDKSASWRTLLLSSFGAIAVLTDPTAIYLVGLTAAVVWRHKSWRSAALVALPSIVGIASMLVWLFAARNLHAFLEYAIRFNRDIYAVFGRPGASSAQAMLPYEGVWRQLSTALTITDGRWWSLMPQDPLSLPGAVHDRWLLTGAAYRLYVIILTVLLLWRRDYARAVGIYGFAALALALRGEEGFHSSTFALIGILCGFILATNGVSELHAPRPRHCPWIPRAVAALGLSVLVFSAGTTMLEQRSTWGYKANFGYYKDMARKVDKWTCGDRRVHVSHWPSDLLLNWFADRLPVSRFGYVLPWTLSISEDDIRSSLDRYPALVIVDLDGSVGPFLNREYLAPLLRYMEATFVPVERGVFASRDVASCQSALRSGDPLTWR